MNIDQSINYIEFAVANIARAKQFYGQAFGWTFTDYGPSYSAFNSGSIEGGFTTDGAVLTGGGPLVILYADDLEATQEKLERAGGRIAMPIFAFPGGRRFHFTDLDGYELAVWSDK